MQGMMRRFGRMTEEEWLENDKRLARQRAADEVRDREDEWAAIKANLEARGLLPRKLELLASGQTRETTALSAVQGHMGGILALSGHPRCGKTWAAYCWLLGVFPGAKKPKWKWPWRGSRLIEAPELARTSRYGEGQVIDDLKRVPRLVIDDLGAEYSDAKGSFLVDLTEILNSRLERDLPTVITTNLEAIEFKARCGERIVTRIRESGAWVDCGKESLRGVQGEQ